jgi:hypothetical protein
MPHDNLSYFRWGFQNTFFIFSPTQLNLLAATLDLFTVQNESAENKNNWNKQRKKETSKIRMFTYLRKDTT